MGVCRPASDAHQIWTAQQTTGFWSVVVCWDIPEPLGSLRPWWIIWRLRQLCYISYNYLSLGLSFICIGLWSCPRESFSPPNSSLLSKLVDGWNSHCFFKTRILYCLIMELNRQVCPPTSCVSLLFQLALSDLEDLINLPGFVRPSVTSLIWKTRIQHTGRVYSSGSALAMPSSRGRIRILLYQKAESSRRE